MNPWQSITTCLRKFAEFNGRARRSEYWWFNVVVYVLVFGVAPAIDTAFKLNELIGQPNNLTAAGPLRSVLSLGLFLPLLAVTVRRLHDRGLTGWWAIIGCSGFGLFILQVIFLWGSKPDNYYGPSPVHSPALGGPGQWGGQVPSPQQFYGQPPAPSQQPQQQPYPHPPAPNQYPPQQPPPPQYPPQQPPPPQQ